jgi:AraC-like DNA-binding protein
MPSLNVFRPDRPPEVLVEDRASVSGAELEFSVYDTHQPAEAVPLRTPHLLYCGMVTGRKVVHAEEEEETFEFVPGQSLVLPPGARVTIDFPDADRQAPTTCLTLALAPSKVQRILERVRRPSSLVPEDWRAPDAPVLVGNAPGLEQVLRTLVGLFAGAHPQRDALIDINVAELVVRMLQTEARMLLLGQTEAADHGLAAALRYVHRHLDRHIAVQELAEVACMSPSTLHRTFRQELGTTPLRYMTDVRMRQAQELLRDPARTVTAVSYDLGFESVSHFIKTFKKHVGDTPKAYQDRVTGGEAT